MKYTALKDKILKELRKSNSTHVYDDKTFHDFAKTFGKYELSWIWGSTFYVVEYTHNLKFIIEFSDSISMVWLSNTIESARRFLRQKICYLIVTENDCTYDIAPACTIKATTLLTLLKDGKGYCRGYSNLKDMFDEKLALPQAKDL